MAKFIIEFLVEFPNDIIYFNLRKIQKTVSPFAQALTSALLYKLNNEV